MGRHSPPSDYNGRVWPHDNALLTEGLHKYGLDKEGAMPGRNIMMTINRLKGSTELFSATKGLPIRPDQ